MTQVVRELKGGSLSSTRVMKIDNDFVVRKSISKHQNREFGFYRWISQYKRLQRYSEMFPGVFPRVVGSGQTDDTYYFDIPYYDGYINGFEYLSNDLDAQKISRFFEKVILNLELLHAHEYSSVRGGFEIFFNEEVRDRLQLLQANEKTKPFLCFDHFVFNGQNIDNSMNDIPLIEQKLSGLIGGSAECFTHGNITLENIIVSPDGEEVLFIDPYEENYFDSVHQEFSQMLQSSNSLYEVYLNTPIEITDNIVTANADPHKSIGIFNGLLQSWLGERFTSPENRLIKFYEMAQFIRMAPFKLVRDPDQAKFFLLVAFKIYQDGCLDEFK